MRGPVLDREEYIEQEYFFRTFRQRLEENVPSQEILKLIQEEILATTRLPMAIDFMRAEVLHTGRISAAMERLPHYFASFQAFVMSRADDEESRFEQITALRILEAEASYRARSPQPAGLFVFQFECIARNRLGYSAGLLAMASDPMYTDEWSDWIRRLRNDLGGRELAEIVYVASQHFQSRRRTLAGTNPAAAGDTEAGSRTPALFGDHEGRIARANVGRDPLYFFAALQRQLDYPGVPRSITPEVSEKLPGFVEARLAKIEQRMKILEMETRGGLDLSKFYKNPEAPASES